MSVSRAGCRRTARNEKRPSLGLGPRNFFPILSNKILGRTRAQCNNFSRSELTTNPRRSSSLRIKCIGDVVSIDQQGGSCMGYGFHTESDRSIVRQAASNSGLSRVAPHDLRRTCAKLCHEAGGELEQIQFLLGHVSVQTTERYLGCTTLSQCSERSHRLGTGLIMSPWSIIPYRLVEAHHRKAPDSSEWIAAEFVVFFIKNEGARILTPAR